MSGLQYSQSRGRLTGPGIDAEAYSGRGADKNDPDAQEHHGTGPIPRGRWLIGKPIFHTELGPLAIPLTPAPGTQTFGRSGFYLHGDSILHPGEASDGCIVAGHPTRVAVEVGGFTGLEVVR